jgi:hypothetical protein
VSIKEVHHSFAYVHIKQEKGSKYYYLLPEFNYTALRPDFMADSAIFKMKEFFSDSRKLFTGNSIGSSEYIVSQESEVGDLYKSYLQGYYSVLLEERSDTKSPELLKTELSNYIHKVIEPNGKYAYVSGMYNTKEEALGNKRFFQDCLVSNPLKIVFISPQEFTPIAE